MKRFKSRLLGICLLVTGAFLTSCSSDDDQSNQIVPSDFANGIFILNEGTMGNANASVSFLSQNGVVQNNIYQTVNGQLLGDIAQNIYAKDDRVYIVLNGSGTIEVVNRYSFEKIGTINAGLSNPRYIIIEDGKGYVTNWGDPANPQDDFVAVVNLSSLTVETTIPVVEGPEKMEEENGKIFVAHAGGWGTGNTISVIDAVSNTVVSTITVGDIPNSLKEENGKLYVMCGGKPAWTQDETLGGLYIINLTNLSVESVLTFPQGEHPSQMVEEDGKFYYTLDDKVFSMPVWATSLPTTPLFTMSDFGIFGAYGFEVEEGKIYVADAVDYTSNGKVHIFNLSGNHLETYTVGKLPNGFAFNL